MRHGGFVHRLGIESGDGLRDDDALLKSTMRQRVTGRHIAHRPYARFVGATVRIRGDMSVVVNRHAPCWVGDRVTPDGDKGDFAPDALFAVLAFARVVHGGTKVRAGVHMGDAGAGDDVHAMTFELTGQRGAGSPVPG